RTLIDLDDRLNKFIEEMAAESPFMPAHDEGEEIQIIASAIDSQPESNSIERALSALLAFHNRHAATTEEVEAPVEDTDEGRMNIFSRVHLNDMVKALVGAADFEQFSQPLINRAIAK